MYEERLGIIKYFMKKNFVYSVVSSWFQRLVYYSAMQIKEQCVAMACLKNNSQIHAMHDIT